VYIRIGPSCVSACHTASKENEKGFPEGNILDGWNEIGDFVSRYTGRKFEKLVFITHRELVEQPSDPPTISISQHFYGTMDDALLQAIREKSPMVWNRVSSWLYPTKEYALLAWQNRLI
jgi:hypothetical protein